MRHRCFFHCFCFFSFHWVWLQFFSYYSLNLSYHPVDQECCKFREGIWLRKQSRQNLGGIENLETLHAKTSVGIVGDQKVGDKFKTSFSTFLFPSSFLLFSEIESLLFPVRLFRYGYGRMKHIDELGARMEPGDDRVERGEGSTSVYRGPLMCQTLFWGLVTYQWAVQTKILALVKVTL